MRIFKNLSLILSTPLFIGVVNAQDGEFSISQAEDYGVQNNEKVKNVLLDYEAARKKVWETTAIGLPQVNVEGSFQHMIDIPTSVVDATLFNPMAPPGEIMTFQMGQKYSTSATLNVSQLVFDGSYIVGLRFSKFYTKMAQTSITNTEMQVRELVREAYYNVLVADKNVALMDSILISTEKMWKDAQVYRETGFIPEEEVAQLELAYNRIVASKQNALRQSAIARRLLKLQMGYDMESEILLTETLDTVLLELEKSNPAMQETDVKNNSNYVMLEQQKTLDGYNLQNEKAKYLPSVGAFFSHSQNAYRNEFNFLADEPWYPTTVWGVSVQVPITSSGQKIMRVQQAEIKLEQDDNNLTNLEKNLKFQEFQLKSIYLNAYELMKIEESNVALASKIYNNALKKRKAGVISALEVTQLQQQLLTAEGNYILAVMELLSVKIALDKLYNQ